MCEDNNRISDAPVLYEWTLLGQGVEYGPVYNHESITYSTSVSNAFSYTVASACFLSALALWFVHTPASPQPTHNTFSDHTTPPHATSSVAAVNSSVTQLPTSTPVKKRTPSPEKVEAPLMGTTTPAVGKNDVVRVNNPYQTPPLTPEAINERARASLVNILCTTPSSTFNPVSGSGVVVKENLILTNAHVAQYVLLQDTTRIDITCVVRAGSPARPIGTARIAFMPRAWAQKHAEDIMSPFAKSTGESDVALVSIENPKEILPPIPFDTREAVAFTGDTVLIAGYPASFLGGILIQKNLSALSTFTTIPEVLTFSESLVDALNLGNTLLSQQGSSGGGVFNHYGYVVGLIATATLGNTTSDRELRAITMAHIDRTLRTETGMPFASYLEQGDSEELTTLFKPTARDLIHLFLSPLQLSTTTALL